MSDNRKHRAVAADPASFTTTKICPIRHNFNEHLRFYSELEVEHGGPPR